MTAGRHREEPAGAGRAAARHPQPGVGSARRGEHQCVRRNCARASRPWPAGRAAPEPAAIGAVRRRGRRKLQGGAALVLAGRPVAVGGVRLASGAGDRRGLAPGPADLAAAGPPAAAAPATFVGQVGDGDSRRTAVIDARTARLSGRCPAPSGGRSWPRTRWSAPICGACTSRPPAPAWPRHAIPADPGRPGQRGPAARLRRAGRRRGVQPERRRPDAGLHPHHRPRGPGPGAVRGELPLRAGRA